ncbi:pectin lyase-like protein [Polyplosphaeria fusca]|uniref:Pectin lyase-like protein n=1 Tax=Polyplosphaeria fusca TaxID=682080 RepID=A0A9P4QIS6_9PLEO|nr:pectin lyase-like protein [Polyplosphaeria fusca]
MLFSFVFAVAFVHSLAIAIPNELQVRDPCKPLAQGWEQVDDAPAINDALKACGKGGTIVIPADQTYSIRSPIDFSPCKQCDFQIEGTLLSSRDQWNYWYNDVDSIMTFANVHGARVRSITGSGVIDGNAVDYYNSRWDSGLGRGKGFVHITNGSSDIRFENLRMKNVMQRFFLLDGQSVNMSFEGLALGVEGQWGLYPRNEQETFGFEMGDVREVTIKNIDMNFRSRPNHGGTTGVCAAFDVGTHNVTMQDVTCNGAWGGALVMVDTIVPNLKPLSLSNILVSNFTFNGTVATGFQDYISNATISNVIWDGLNLLKGVSAMVNLCYLRSHNWTGWYFYCQPAVNATLVNIWFKNLRGGGDTPDIGVYKNSSIDVHVENWPRL